MHAKVILLLYAAVTVVTSRRLKKDPCNGLPDDTFIVNPKGCKYFLSCKSGVGVGAYCPHGLWFNPKDRICDLPAQVDCHLDDPVTTTTTTELPTRTWTPSLSTIRPTTSIASTSSSTTATMTTTTQLPVIEDDQEEIVCPMHDLDVIQFVASKINCRQYYICYHGRAVLQECSEKLHWNAKANKCDRPKDAACNIIPKPPMRFPKCPNSGNRFYPHPTECGYYIYCRNGFYSIQQCPFYHHWDVSTESCKWRRFTHCATTSNEQRRRRRRTLRKNNSRKYF